MSLTLPGGYYCSLKWVSKAADNLNIGRDLISVGTFFLDFVKAVTEVRAEVNSSRKGPQTVCS